MRLALTPNQEFFRRANARFLEDHRGLGVPWERAVDRDLVFGDVPRGPAPRA